MVAPYSPAFPTPPGTEGGPCFRDLAALVFAAALHANGGLVGMSARAINEKACAAADDFLIVLDQAARRSAVNGK